MITWIKTHKLIIVLLLIIIYFFSQQLFGVSTLGRLSIPTPNENAGYSSGLKMALPNIDTSYREYPPTTDVSNRLVVRESFLSLLVKDVPETQYQIVKTAQSLGGYMVNTNLTNPQDAPSSSVVIRIPSKNMETALNIFKEQAIKVVSETLSGTDVTDQYVDNQAKLDTLNRTKAKFDDMLSKTTNVTEILNIQREIINLQSQIDAIKGSQQYLEKTAEMAKLTVYLSTDEIALPYAPTEVWRPDVIFKLAVRSLIGTLRNLGSLAIWLVVYAIIWVPILIGIIIYRKKFSKKTPSST